MAVYYENQLCGFQAEPWKKFLSEVDAMACDGVVACDDCPFSSICNSRNQCRYQDHAPLTDEEIDSLTMYVCNLYQANAISYSLRGIFEELAKHLIELNHLQHAIAVMELIGIYEIEKTYHSKADSMFYRVSDSVQKDPLRTLQDYEQRELSFLHTDMVRRHMVDSVFRELMDWNGVVSSDFGNMVSGRVRDVFWNFEQYFETTKRSSQLDESVVSFSDACREVVMCFQDARQIMNGKNHLCLNHLAPFYQGENVQDVIRGFELLWRRRDEMTFFLDIDWTGRQPSASSIQLITTFLIWLCKKPMEEIAETEVRCFIGNTIADQDSEKTKLLYFMAPYVLKTMLPVFVTDCTERALYNGAYSLGKFVINLPIVHQLAKQYGLNLRNGLLAIGTNIGKMVNRMTHQIVQYTGNSCPSLFRYGGICNSSALTSLRGRGFIEISFAGLHLSAKNAATNSNGLIFDDEIESNRDLILGALAEMASKIRHISNIKLRFDEYIDQDLMESLIRDYEVLSKMPLHSFSFNEYGMCCEEERSKEKRIETIRRKQRRIGVLGGTGTQVITLPSGLTNHDALFDCIISGIQSKTNVAFNVPQDYCVSCGFRGEIQIDPESGGCVCPNCGERNMANMDFTRRVRGNIVVHLNDYDEIQKTKRLILERGK